jgi:hypothetical protein
MDISATSRPSSHPFTFAPPGRTVRATPVYVSKERRHPVPARCDLPTVIRHEIGDSRKKHIDCEDEADRPTERVIKPFAVLYYIEAALLRVVRTAQRHQALSNRPYRRRGGTR